MAAKKKTLASALFDDGYVLVDPEKGALLNNIKRTDGKQTTVGDIRSVQAIVYNWNRKKKP